jgi:membrane-associated phospholipid phosphatase
MKKLQPLFLIVLCLILGIVDGYSQSESKGENDVDYRVDYESVYELQAKKEYAILGSGVGFFGASYLFQKNRELLTQTEIENLDIQDINSFDRGATMNLSESADRNSDYVRNASVVLPLGLFLLKKGRKEYKAISLMYLETGIFGNGFNAFAKTGVGRIRPFVYNDEVPLEEKQERTATRSFYSGHVSQTASMSFLTAKILTDLYPDSRYKWLFWTGATVSSGATAYYRYKAGKHFPTDVIVGAIVGGTIGVLIPQIHKINRENVNISLFQLDNGGGIRFRFTI